MVPLSLMMSVLVVGTLLPCHQSWFWKSSNVVALSRTGRLNCFLKNELRGGGGGGGGGSELYEPNTSGFGPNVMMGGFLSHIYVLSSKSDLDSVLHVLKHYIPPSTKNNVVCEAFQEYMRPIHFEQEEDEFRKMLVVCIVTEKPLYLICRERRDNNLKLVGVQFVEDDNGREHVIYCLTVLDSFGDKERELLADLKQKVGSDLGYVGNMLSPPPCTVKQFMRQTGKESNVGNLMNQKLGFFAEEEMTVKEWIANLRQTGGKMVSKPELLKYSLFSNMDNIKETFGLNDAEEIEMTPAKMKTFFQGDLWEYPNWEFRATRDCLLVQFGDDRGAAFQWKEPLKGNPQAFATGRGIVNVVENDGENFFII